METTFKASEKRQILESHINFFGLNWDVVERHFPNYSSSDDILRLDIMTRFLDGEHVDVEDLSDLDAGGDPYKQYIGLYQDILDRTLYKVKALAPMGKDFIPQGVILDKLSKYEIEKCVLANIECNLFGQRIHFSIARKEEGFTLQAGTYVNDDIAKWEGGNHYYIHPEYNHKQVAELAWEACEAFVAGQLDAAFQFKGKAIFKSNLEINVEC